MSGYKESGVSLRREECEYVPWSRDDSWQILHTKVGRKRMRKKQMLCFRLWDLQKSFILCSHGRFTVRKIL